MTEPFYSRESLLNLAVEIEKSAEAFYTALADKFAQSAETFKQLAQDEKGHAISYSRLLSKGENVAGEKGLEKARSYIEALDSLDIVASLRKLDRDALDPKDLAAALDLAISLEKDTLLLYQTLLLYLVNDKDRRVIHMVTDVEYVHLVRLSRMRAKSPSPTKR